MNSRLVPGAGVEPARGYPRGILSPLRLPVSPPGQAVQGEILQKSPSATRTSDIHAVALTQ